VIDTSFSQIHSILVTDLDNDGRREFVAGKRYLATKGVIPVSGTRWPFTGIASIRDEEHLSGRCR